MNSEVNVRPGFNFRYYYVITTASQNMQRRIAKILFQCEVENIMKQKAFMLKIFAL
jgi:hypothetical protein